MLKTVLRAAALLVWLAPAAAFASPITYTLTGDFSGTLTGTSSSTIFTNSPFTWIGTGDTSSLTTTLDGFPAVQLSGGSIQLPAIGAVTAPTVPFYLAVAQAFGAGGFVNLADNQGLSLSDPNFFAYSPTQALGPDSVAFNGALPFSTGLGTLDFTGGSNLVFTASTAGGGGGGNVPEPGTAALLGAGLIAAFALDFLRRRKVLFS